MIAPAPIPPARSVSWQRNLAVLWFAEFTAIFGFSFCFPFLPLYLRDLGVHSQNELAVWAGLSGGASGFALAVSSPIWGAIADRYGRKSMLVRAMIGGGITVLVMGFARGPVDVVVLRFVQGLSSGTVAAATALVATGTPRHKVGWALGILSSSIATAGAVGPALGGIVSAYSHNLRVLFIGGGLLLLVSTLPVLLLVREPAYERRTAATTPALAVLRQARSGTLSAIVVLLVAQGFLQMSFSAFQPLVALRILAHAGNDVNTITGVTFGAIGLASAVAAVVYSGAAKRFGYLQVAIIAAVLMGLAEVTCGIVPSPITIVFAGAVAGFAYGALQPAVSSMIGLESPAVVQARVFGLAASATALGFGIGPVLGGTAAAETGLMVGLAIAAVLGVVVAVLLAVRGREPVR
ncbi:MAG TPA: MFS transporter [Candidatus Dormibacteraeota bacterium]